MNDSLKKALNVLFRTVIFCLFVASVMMVVRFFGVFEDAIEEESEKLTVNKELFERLGSYASVYKGVFIAGIAAAVLSILSGRYKASGAAVFFRTIIIGSLVLSMSGGVQVCDAIVEICAVVDDIDTSKYEDIEDLSDMDIEILVDAGIDEDRAKELSEAFDNEDAVIPFVLAPFSTSFFYFILTCTSLHNLLKEKPQGADCGGCEDARRVEMYDPAMLNGGGHYAQPQPMQQPVMNRMNAVPQTAHDPYIQNIINAANAAHPAHDHHDSAEIHDLEADGEFHNYAQAEADMRDDSSDYISQLQREENRGHRITDEDFM